MSAGGTAEPIDPVRFIGNRSTGRMGVAIAEAALARGARVTIVAGRVEVPLPEAATVVRGRVAPPRCATRCSTPSSTVGADALVMAAAVADFRPSTTASTKLTRGDGLTLQLEPTEDILAEVGARARDLDPRPVIVGFAAETGSLERAPEKLRRKGADLLVANDVSEPGSGFGTDTNRVVILGADGSRDELPLLTKREVADRLLDRVAALLDERTTPAHTGSETHGEPHERPDRDRPPPVGRSTSRSSTPTASGSRRSPPTTTRPPRSSTRPASRSSSWVTRWRRCCWATTPPSA